MNQTINSTADAPHAAASPWTYLETFELEIASPTNKLYSNGRQQVQITVKLRAIDDNAKVIPLSAEQKASVKLIDYESGVVLPAVPVTGRVTSGWGSTPQRNEFAFFSALNALESDVVSQTRTPAAMRRESAQGYEFVTLFVQTVDASPKRIGAEIRRDSETLYQSNGDDFKCSVEALPQRMPLAKQTRAVDLHWEAYRVEGDDNEWDMTTVDYYYCGVSVNGQRNRLISFSAAPASMFQWESNNGASDTFSFTGYCPPGGATPTYTVPSAFNQYKHAKISMPRANEGVIVLIRAVGVRQDSATGVPKQSCDVTAVDEAGNDHLLRVSFKSSSNRNELTVTRR